MNRNLDGTELTNEQLIEFAVKGGTSRAKLTNAVAEAHNVNLIRSLLLEVSREERFAAMFRGELTLDTRTTRQ